MGGTYFPKTQNTVYHLLKKFLERFQRHTKFKGKILNQRIKFLKLSLKIQF